MQQAVMTSVRPFTVTELPLQTHLRPDKRFIVTGASLRNETWHIVRTSLKVFIHRNRHTIFFRKIDRFLIAGIGMADDAHAGVGGEDAFDAFCGFGGAVGDCDPRWV